MEQVEQTSVKPTFFEQHKDKIFIGLALLAGVGITYFALSESDTEYIKKKLKKVTKIVKEKAKETVKVDSK